MTHAKSDREALHLWLSAAAMRLRWSRTARDLGWLAAALVALWISAKAVPSSPVRSALIPLLLAAACALVALFLWRLARPTTLAQAASAADASAGLKDELKSAQWFARDSTQNARVEILIARAARTARALDTRSLFPLRIPRGALAALALVVLSVAWVSPGIVLPTPKERAAAPQTPVPSARDTQHSAEVRPPFKPLPNDRPSPGTSQADALAAPPVAKADSITPVASARGEGVATARRSERDGTATRDLATRPDLKAAVSAQQPAEPPPGAVGRTNKVPVEPPVKAEIAPTTRVLTKLREQSRLEQRKITGQPTQGNVTLNSRLRAVSRSGASMREVAYGEGEAAEAGAQTSVSGAASGDRTGRSQAGGSEGEHPNSSPTGDGDDQPVLGESTQRLQAVIEKMGFGPAPESQGRETEEKFYAATQRRAARAASDTIIVQWRLQQEKALAPGETPLSYREAVKQYFLSQHAKER
ncbi:MAG: hypothetical protein ACKVQA_21130 [Burkholderiales bacterium]